MIQALAIQGYTPCLLRDDYRCVVTGDMDMGRWLDLGEPENISHRRLLTKRSLKIKKQSLGGIIQILPTSKACRNFR